MLVNLALEEKTKALRIGDTTQVQAEMWLFDPSHQVENLGTVELSGQIPVLPQSISLYIIQE